MASFLTTSTFSLLFANVFGVINQERPTCGTILGLTCPDSMTCQYDSTCDPAKGGADCGGICVTADGFSCGGFLGDTCSDSEQVCADDPYDDCDPLNGGADCIGICVYPGDECSICDMTYLMGAPAGLCPNGECYGNCGTCTWELDSRGLAYCDRLVPQDRVCPTTSTTAAGSTSSGCMCTKEYIPLCCGGQTYGNLCMARCDGFAESDCTDGACTATTAAATTTDTAGCCDIADKPAGCDRELCQCCPDGTWIGSIGDAKTFPCSGGDLTYGIDVFGTVCDTTTSTPTTTSTDTTVGGTKTCCDINDQTTACGFEGCECCPDGTWVGSIGDGKTYPCSNGQNTLTLGVDTFGEVCDSASTTSAGCICTKEYVPVCCEGTTYSNSCQAECDGFGFVDCSSGACTETTTATRTTSDTKTTTATKSTSATKTTSDCVCYEIYDPYCCGDTTYSNDCYAACGGYDVTAADSGCTQGRCSTPCICTLEYDPYCCRGSTYGNSCAAKCDGFDADADCTSGECDTSEPTTDEPDTTSVDSDICPDLRKAYKWERTANAICKLCLYPGVTKDESIVPVCSKFEEMANDPDVQDCVLEVCGFNCDFEFLALKDDVTGLDCGCDWFECTTGNLGAGASHIPVIVAVAFMLFITVFAF